MRLHSRLILGFWGLSLAAASDVTAAPPDGYGSVAMPSSYGASASASPTPVIAGTAPADPVPHKHKSIFARRHCVECQRAAAKRESGIDVPPPPGFANDPTAHIHPVGVTIANCPKCKSMGVIAGPGAEAPGFAVADGSAQAHDRPGFAVVNGDAQAEPSPIGVARGGQQPPWANARMATARGRAGYDPSVVPTSIPPAQVAVPDGGHDRPHILGHLFGVSQIRNDLKAHRERRKESGPAHASITYDESAKAVNELPASVVYGNGGH